MKLHLPKTLLSAIAVIWALSPVYAETINLGSDTSTKTVNNGITVGNGEYIGYKENDVLKDDSFTEGVRTNSLLLRSESGWIVKSYTYHNLEINGNGRVVVAGKHDSNNYAGITANKVTVNGDGTVTNLISSSMLVKQLEINGGTVLLHTDLNSGGLISGGNGYIGYMPYTNVDGLADAEANKQVTITDSLLMKNGSLTIGVKNGYGIQFDKNGKEQRHYLSAFGGSISQEGGDMTVHDMALASGNIQITQTGGTMSLSATSDATDNKRFTFNGNGTATIEQSGGEGVKMTIGTLSSYNQYGTPDQNVVQITQKGKGEINLTNGADYQSKNGADSSITQQGGGVINLAGSFENVEYDITQEQSGGQINLAGSMTADQVEQTTKAATLTVQTNAKLTATTMNTKGTVKNYGTIDTKDLTVSGEYLINYGDIDVSGTLKIEGGQLQTNAAGATTHSSITAANVVMGEGTYFHHDNATIKIDKLTATESEIRVRQDESSLVIGKEGVDTVHEVSNTTIITSGTNLEQSDALTLYVHGTLKGDNNTIYGSAVIDRVEGSGFKFQDQGFNNSQLKVGSIAGGYIDVLNQKGGVEIGSIVSNDAASVSAIKAYQIGDVVVDSIDDKGQMELYAATGNVTVNGAATAATLNIAAGAEVSIGGALNVGTADIESYNGGITLNGGVADTLTLEAATGKYSYLYGETRVGDLNVDGGHFQVKSSTGKLNAENIQLDNAGAYALFDGSTTAENIISNGANVYSRINKLTVNNTLQLNGGSLTVSNDGTLNAGHLELNGVSSVYVTNGALHVDKLSSTTGLQVTASGAGSELVIGKQGESEIHEANDAWFYLSDGVTLQVNGTLKGDSIQVNGAASIDQVEGNAFYLSNLTEQNVSIGMIKGDNANIGNTNGNVEIGKLETSSNDSRSYISARETGDVSIGSIQDSGRVSVTAYGGNISVTGDVSSADLYITASKDVSIGGTLNAEKALLSAGGTMDLNGGTVGELHLTANSTDTVITLNTNEDLNVLGSLNLGNGYGLELDFELNSLDDNGAIIMGDGADLIFAQELTEASVSLSLSDVAKQIMLDGSSSDLDTETVFTFTLISNLGEQDVEELTQAINGKLVLNSDELVLTIPNAVDFEHSLLLVQNGELRVEGNSLVVDVVTQTVPEPTTATLSLLALAALAARRRRR